MTSLLRTSAEAETRILTRAGAIFVVCIAAVVSLHFAVNPFANKQDDVISVGIETPYVGEGVAGGTPVIMHGVKVGEVTAVSNIRGGGVRLKTNLQSRPVSGLTTAMGIDFRPSNYFGVTGVNLIPGEGGEPLRTAAEIKVIPKGNYTLQRLLYRLGELSNQVVTPLLVDVIERVTRYTDALNPLLETMVVVATSVTDVQTVSTEQLLRNTTGVNVAYPGFADALINTGDMFLRTYEGIGFDPEVDLQNNPFVSTYDEKMLKQYNDARHLLATNPDEFVRGRFNEWLTGAETGLFYKVGHLLSSHPYELYPVVNEIRAVADVVPILAPATEIADTLRELRTRLERMYEGSEEQRALQVRIVLDALPGVAAPMGLALGAAG